MLRLHFNLGSLVYASLLITFLEVDSGIFRTSCVSLSVA